MIVNRQGLADVLGKSLPTIDRYVREGCPVKTQGRKGIQWEFSVPDVVDWLGARERENAKGGIADGEDELKRRKLQAETGKAELEFARAKGEVAPVREFERATAKLMANIRANILNVPARAVLQLLGETDESTFKQSLRTELVMALEQSAQDEIDLEDDDDDADDDGESE